MAKITPRVAPAFDIDYFPPYKEPDPAFLMEQAEKLMNWIWKDNDNPVLRKEIVTDFKCILEIIDMVERRRIYYHIFHKCMDMSECKEIALYCYWILKLQPFFHIKQGNKVNTIIAYRLLLNMAKATDKHLPSGILYPLLHSFRYHDISKEALVALCESFFADSR